MLAATLSSTIMAQALTTYIIEPQAFFAPYLADVLAQAGVSVRYISENVDDTYLLSATPDLVFVDLDFFTQTAEAIIRSIRGKLRRGILCVYTANTSATFARDAHIAGANALFTKLAEGEELVAGLKTAICLGAYTDPRFTAIPDPAAH